MTTPVTLSVGIVTFESRVDVFQELLRSLHDSVTTLCRARPAAVSVYVVCNDEGPQDIQAIRQIVEDAGACPGKSVTFELMAGHGNIGYGAAQNLAIEQVSSDYHLMLNPDVVLADNTLLECVKFLESGSGAVMLSPQGFDANRNYACLAKRNPTVLVLLLRALSVRSSDSIWGREIGRYIYSDKLPSARPEVIDHASGCFMFCDTGTLQQVGGFDARYFLYFEDYDLSRRIARYGSIYELPSVQICHYGGMTIRRGWRRIGHFIRSAFRFFNHYGWRVR